MVLGKEMKHECNYIYNPKTKEWRCIQCGRERISEYEGLQELVRILGIIK